MMMMMMVMTMVMVMMMMMVMMMDDADDVYSRASTLRDAISSRALPCLLATSLCAYGCSQRGGAWPCVGGDTRPRDSASSTVCKLHGQAGGAHAHLAARRASVRLSSIHPLI